MLRSNSKSLWNHVVSPEKKKKGCSGKDLQKRLYTWTQSVVSAHGPTHLTAERIGI